MGFLLGPNIPAGGIPRQSDAQRMTRVLVLFAHPCEESFSSALKSTVVETLTRRGWEVDLCDLYAENFNPVLTAAERRGYLTVPDNCGPVQPYVDRLRAAQALIFVFPVWNFGFPAILKGFIDRVFLPGVSFKLEDGLVAPALTHIRKMAAVTTYGATRWRAFLAADPPKRVITRALWFVARPDKMRYLALHDMNRVTDDQRRRYLATVQREMERL
jgi:NAD(P)H dehydrogenase (quinone)